MNRPEIAPFADEHVEEAATLLAKRHARHRAVEPLLPAEFEDPDTAREELEVAWRRQDASGAAALRGGRLVGYIVGAPREDPVWGANVWVELAGQAVEEAEVARDLYATAALRWVEEGRTRHYTFVPASDEPLVTAWFRLGFGQQQAHGLREVPKQVDVILPEGIQIRGPDPAEIDTLIDIDLALPQHQRASPVFSGVSLATREASRAEWLSTLAGEEEKIFIGVIRGRPVACWALVPLERSREHHGLLQPEGASYLGFASTLPGARGSGVGVALTNASLAWAAKQGYATMVTDWRVTNLLASRFWPRRGFREAFLRLYRSIP